MNELDRARHDAAVKLQQYVIDRSGNPFPVTLHDPEAMAVIDAISACVVKTIEHYLADVSEKRAGNGD